MAERSADRPVRRATPSTITHPRKSRNRSKISFIALWKKISIVVVAWVLSVLVYVEFFKVR